MAEYKDNLLGEANSFLEVLEQVSHLAPLDKPVLIIGERGTGKELIASRLHYLSSRWQGPFISLNCAALNENLLDSELFGHEAGAFTGAQKRHPGRFERADGGTLFLDELATAPMMVQEKLLRVIEYGELERVGGSQPLQVNVRLVCATNADLPAMVNEGPMMVQEKLLRVIEYGELERVGGSQPLQVNVRLVCATNADLPAMVNEGTFRADLLDRLAFDVVQLPPLRERESDIMLMAEHFAIQMCREIKLPLFPGFPERARETLLNYRWPGNIRELKNVVERSVYRHGTSDSPLDDIIIDPFKRRPPEDAIAVSETTSLPTLPLDLREFQMARKRHNVDGRTLCHPDVSGNQAASVPGVYGARQRNIAELSLAGKYS